MKTFVALTCLLAVASAGLVAPHSVLIQPQHLPIIDSNGVPVEPLVNQVARAQHAELKLAAHLRNGDAALVASPLAAHGIVAPAALAAPAPLALAAHGAVLAAPQHLPVIDANGVPVEPLANQIARAQNAAAHINAHARNGDLAILGRKKRGIVSPLAYAVPQHLPIIDSNGVPVEPLVNQVARAQHAELRLAAQIRNGDAALVASPLAAHGIVAPAALAAPAPLALAAHGAVLAAPQHLPVIDANGVPVEPLANQIARAQNAAAHINAHALNGNLAILGRKKRGIVAPLAYAAPQHLPIIDSNGVPVEPLVNQVARAQHAELRLAAQIRNGDAALIGAPVALAAAHAAPIAVAHAAGPVAVAHSAPIALAAAPHAIAVPAAVTSVSHIGRVPLDTPEVAALKAAHLATKSGLIL